MQAVLGRLVSSSRRRSARSRKPTSSRVRMALRTRFSVSPSSRWSASARRSIGKASDDPARSATRTGARKTARAKALSVAERRQSGREAVLHVARQAVRPPPLLGWGEWTADPSRPWPQSQDKRQPRLNGKHAFPSGWTRRRGGAHAAKLRRCENDVFRLDEGTGLSGMIMTPINRSFPVRRT